MNAATPTSPFGRLAGLYYTAERLIGKLQPLLLLGFRLYVARVFFLSGQSKIEGPSIPFALNFHDLEFTVTLPRSGSNTDGQASTAAESA